MRCRMLGKAWGRVFESSPTSEVMGTTGEIQATAAPGRAKFPALDGLRGSAVLLVLMCHYSSLLPANSFLARFLENGWLGVDLFFVISGFLITGILFDAKGSTNYFRNFYARRTLRIFPLYYAFLIAILIFLLALRFSHLAMLNPLRLRANPGLELFWQSQPWLWTYTANIWIAKVLPTSTWTALIKPLWSLSVEEQFYLIWPLVIAWFSHRALIKVSLGLMLLAALARWILTAHGTDYFAIYISTPTRFDALAAGALLALLLRLPDGDRRARKICKFAGPIAGLMILIVSPGFDPIAHPWLRDFLYSALAIFFAALLFWSIDSASLYGIPNRFYQNRLLRIIGGYSYAMYLFHVPLMFPARALVEQGGFFQSSRDSWMQAMALVGMNAALTFGLAFLSFHLFEKQFLKLKRFFPEPASRQPSPCVR